MFTKEANIPPFIMELISTDNSQVLIKVEVIDSYFKEGIIYPYLRNILDNPFTILEILKKALNYPDGYTDGAYLISQCTDIEPLSLVKDGFNDLYLKENYGNLSVLELMIEILLLGVAYCKSIESSERIALLLDIQINTRCIKCTIIDAFKIMEDELEVNTYLEQYLLDEDLYVQEQAKEALEKDD